jgi:hypothetical protein
VALASGVLRGSRWVIRGTENPGTGLRAFNLEPWLVMGTGTSANAVLDAAQFQSPIDAEPVKWTAAVKGFGATAD